MKSSAIAIWLIRGAVVAITLGLLTFGTQRLIRYMVTRWRDPLGDFHYGERHSDFDGDEE